MVRLVDYCCALGEGGGEERSLGLSLRLQGKKGKGGAVRGGSCFSPSQNIWSIPDSCPQVGLRWPSNRSQSSVALQ